MNIGEFYNIVFNGQEQLVNKLDIKKVDECYNFLCSFSKDKVVYGINTGFGPMAQYRVEDHKIKQLQYNIIRSHACGAGIPLPQIYVKAAMVARLQTFIQAHSGVHSSLVELLAKFINAGIYPIVPQHGSVGASGDLVQLSHIALALIGEGEVIYNGEKMAACKAMQAEKIEPLKVYLREGLAVTNGTSVMTGIGLINLIYAKKLLNLSIAASVMMNEIASSYGDFMSEELNEMKCHSGQKNIARIMREFSRDSKCVLKREIELYGSKHTESVFKHKVQPYYSLRCVPQILGPVFDELVNAEQVLINELNSVDDNPVVDVKTKNVYHGGNFHGDYVSFEMDKLKIAITKLTMLTERQLNYLFHDRINGILPPFVNMGVLGLNYGLQAAQFTATSTTAECQTLSNPMYIHSIPNNNDNQDIVSMGTNSALIAKTVIENSYEVMSIHFMAIAQAIDCLNIKDKISAKSLKIYNDIREICPIFIEDTPKYKEIETIVKYLKMTDFNLNSL
ncbi:MAG: aromatic amino acid ammonia-lyase [Bacteroidales bacterium]